jgi:hypothetical protein
MPRHQHKPTDEQRQQARLLSGYGIPQEQIATMLRLDAKTLRRHYRRELDLGVVQANAAVVQSLYTMAVRDKIPAAAIWWTKARMGWRGTTDLNVGGQQDNPVAIDFTWAPALPQPLPAAGSPPTIEAEADVEAEDAEAGEVVVTWEGEGGK